MKIKIITVGKNMPQWVNLAVADYIKRFPSNLKIIFKEISARLNMQKQSKQILSLIQPRDITIALDINGKSYSTEQLSQQLTKWQVSAKPINILIGSADGLSSECLQASTSKWSLSPLTLAHPLARVILIEQIYRAWSILNNHPYHRA